LSPSLLPALPSPNGRLEIAVREAQNTAFAIAAVEENGSCNGNASAATDPLSGPVPRKATPFTFPSPSSSFRYHCLRSLESDREAEIRVVGEIGIQGDFHAYGVAFVHAR